MKKQPRTVEETDYEGIKNVVHRLYLEYQRYERPDEELRETLKRDMGNNTKSMIKWR
jgi:hypothetical protein